MIRGVFRRAAVSYDRGGATMHVKRPSRHAFRRIPATVLVRASGGGGTIEGQAIALRIDAFDNAR
jgi:hypothetical protein